MAIAGLWKAETQVNVVDSNATQSGTRLVANTDGSYFVIWVDESGDYGSPSAVVARKFDANGQPLSGEQLLTGTAAASDVEVSSVPGGGFAIVFTSGGTDTFAARYDANGVLTGSTAIEVGAAVSSRPSIAAFADGSMFVTYTVQNSSTDWDIVGRRIDPVGAASAPITLLNDLGGSNNYDHSQVTRLATGNMVVIAESQSLNVNGIPFNAVVDVQIRDPAGTLLNSIALPGSNGNGHAEVAALSNGGFVVAYTKLYQGPTNVPTNATEDVTFAVYDAGGSIVRNEVLISRNAFVDPNAYAPSEPQVIATEGGGFVITWTSSERQFAVRYDDTGNAVSSTREVGTATANYVSSDAGTLADGRVVFAFDDRASGDLDVTHSIWDMRHNAANMATGGNLAGTGASDILIERALPGGGNAGGTKALLTFQVDANQFQSAISIGTVGTEWAIDGVGNFGRDAYQDVLMHSLRVDNPSPHLAFYSNQLTILKQGGNGTQQVVNLGTIGVDTQVYGVGDFDGDGDADVLVARNGVDPAIIRVESYGVAGIDTLSSLPSGRQIVGVGDVDRDHDTDILLQNDVGNVRHIELIRMTGGVAQAPVEIGAIGHEWQIDGFGDFDGDGDQDLLIHRSEATGQTLAIIELENGTVASIAMLGTVGLGVSIDSFGDFDRDGDSDVALHYDQGGLRHSLVLALQDNVAQTVHEVGSTGLDWLIN